MQSINPPFIVFDDVEYNQLEDIPLLVRDYDFVEKQIDDAKAMGRAQWYEESQYTVWDGPYRHHLLKRKQYVQSILQNYIKNKQEISLLDLGCGDGTNLDWLKSYATYLYGSDYNILRLLRAKKKNLAQQIVLADVTDYPAKDNSFDIIFFNHVLEHIPEDTKALSEVFRILKKGGICILGVPNEGAFWWQLAYRLQPESRRTTDHVHFYTVPTLSKKILDIGFHIQKIKKLGWGLPHWTFDSMVRGYKIFNDLFEFLGKIFLPNQSSSLYFIIEKQ